MPPPSANWLQRLLTTTRGKILVVGGIVGLFGIGAFMAFTTTDVGTIKAGQCFANWDDFGRGSNISDNPRNADCDEPHAVQAYWVTGSQVAFSPCDTRFETEVRSQDIDDLDWFGVEVERFGKLESVICFVGHRDEETLITGSVVVGS